MLEYILNKLEKKGHLIRIKEQVDPNLEMASIHLRIFEKNGPAILYENVKGSRFRAVSNIFGNRERCEIIFGKRLDLIKKLGDFSEEPLEAIKNIKSTLKVLPLALKSIPKKNNLKNIFNKCNISDLPKIKSWPEDGGSFITLPMVYTENINNPSIKQSNLGMYRVQLDGNNYIYNKEIGLHYQIHRGIGVHQTMCEQKNKNMKVSVFVGGHPGHILSAVMPLPEAMSEILFAGMLSNKRFSYCYDNNGNFISLDSDFVITGEVETGANKPEGPFGDHLGYYSLKHDFPVMKVRNVYYKKNAIWAFTVVGRPPQEDTFFGKLIHEMTSDILPKKYLG